MAKVKMFRAEYGASFETNAGKAWHKLGAAIEVEIGPDDDTKKVKEMAWNTVFTEVEKQIKDITGQGNNG